MGTQVAAFKFRDYHHRIALLLAVGKRQTDVASELGMSPWQISRITKNPGFDDLVAGYRKQADRIEFDAFRQVTKVMAGVQLLAVELIRDKLMDDPDDLSVRELIDIFSDMSDRLGHSKVSRQESKNLSVSIDLADSLAEARRREMRLSASAPPMDADGGPATSPAEGPASQ